MKYITLFPALLLSLSSCDEIFHKETIPTIGIYPKCIEGEIKILEEGYKEYRNPEAWVKKYKYKGKIVYAVNEPGAYSNFRVYDENCNNICTRGGGFSGSVDTCIDWDKAVFLGKVWEDPR